MLAKVTKTSWHTLRAWHQATGPGFPFSLNTWFFFPVFYLVPYNTLCTPCKDIYDLFLCFIPWGGPLWHNNIRGVFCAASIE
jgi:hypothetical protein